MAGDIELEVRGLREFRRDLRRIDPEVDKELRTSIRQSADRIRAEAASVAPYRSGALSRSLRISVTQRSASIYSTLPYAPVVHWGGTIEPKGVPIKFRRTEFISKAVERGADQLAEDIADGVERAARRTGWH